MAKHCFVFDRDYFYILEMCYRRGNIVRVPPFLFRLCVSTTPPPPSWWRHKCKPEAQLIVPEWGDKVDYGIGLSYRPAMLHRLACHSRLYPPVREHEFSYCFTKRRKTKKGYHCDIWHLGVGKRYNDSKGSVRIFQNILFAGWGTICFVSKRLWKNKG